MAMALVNANIYTGIAQTLTEAQKHAKAFLLVASCGLRTARPQRPEVESRAAEAPPPLHTHTQVQCDACLLDRDIAQIDQG